MFRLSLIEMGFSGNSKFVLALATMIVAFAGAANASTSATFVVTGSSSASNLGTLKGIVRDDLGKPIAAASVEIFRDGATRVLRQLTAGNDGSFMARLAPGRYKVAASATGFNPATVTGIDISKASQTNRGIQLKRAGSGNTLPEQRVDRNSSKWRIRAAQSSRSIYQNTDGDEVETVALPEPVESSSSFVSRPSAVIETYYASTRGLDFVGLNAATLIPINEKAQLMLAGQTATAGGPQRGEVRFSYRVGNDHDVSIGSSVRQFGIRPSANASTNSGNDLTQISFQATDQWNVREGLILLYGVDYTRFVGGDSAMTPRVGLQFDLGSRTRLRAGYTTATEEKNWANAIELEGRSLAFADPVFIDDVVVANGRPKLNVSRRLEAGIERVLDNRSSIEAIAFVDTTTGRGLGIEQIVFNATSGDAFSEFIGEQSGRAQGVRVIYSRRIGSFITASAGYAYGNGQRLSGDSDPAKLLTSDEFQTAYASVSADVGSNTTIRTVYRLSPDAAVFAIDPFRGRLAIFDPGLSVYVTHSLPTFGLPVRAEVIVDARNLLDSQIAASLEDSLTRLNAHRRLVRGGIQLRF